MAKGNSNNSNQEYIYVYIFIIISARTLNAYKVSSFQSIGGAAHVIR